MPYFNESIGYYEGDRQANDIEYPVRPSINHIAKDGGWVFIHPRILEISNLLRELDIKTLRPLRAIYSGTDAPEDHAKLAELEGESISLREELENLKCEPNKTPYIKKTKTSLP